MNVSNVEERSTFPLQVRCSIKAEHPKTILRMQTEICESALAEIDRADRNGILCRMSTFASEYDVVGIMHGFSVQQPNREGTTAAATESDGRDSETEEMGMPPPKLEFDRSHLCSVDPGNSSAP